MSQTTDACNNTQIDRHSHRHRHTNRQTDSRWWQSCKVLATRQEKCPEMTVKL